MLPTPASNNATTTVFGVTYPGLELLGRLAPEIRNAIYSFLLHSPNDRFFVVPTVNAYGKFKLRERSDDQQHEAIDTLNSLGAVSHEIRREARTYFYVVNRFPVLCYGYEYLSIWVRWLDAMRPECRTVLKNVMLHGYMWYQPSVESTQRLHELLRDCTNARHLSIHMSIRHMSEARLSELNAYLNYIGPEPHDGAMLEVDVSAWARTIANMEKLKVFELELVLSVDQEESRGEKERIVHDFYEFAGERGRVLV
ncbi:hypothetical protein EJ02DRAFT_458941 [Clathrospora elynae]|uniref:Uncharacterized protein n=1 Tax=Clathrospora elynae TaxID=706981 RepID=A0A6A5SFC9_9PLEO|nr:hypothetical protein EJ02DRAFT_458941 [Clathrospora elynae]